jgi:hypothetical protein
MLAVQRGLCEQFAMKWNVHLEHTSYSNSLSDKHINLQDEAMPTQLPPQKSEHPPNRIGEDQNLEQTC